LCDSTWSGIDEQIRQGLEGDAVGLGEVQEIADILGLDFSLFLEVHPALIVDFREGQKADA
jgi:hypothetical protein